ncbi:hypothetical protein BDV26DRAFT_158647 [Aspergillus bertholletiae]|uniref:Uncharacterized protein n=1 Tax=Aspergillus bertholletiae TaxID=1226010 RepID=A0A5N7BD46_9EURO|nr:hypothetical protein BDV26DRAFT_158647 [Aspergillus bertholletiae]
MGKPIQYAQLPKFEYQTFERQYQTFDRHTLQFSYYSVASASTDDLTPDNDQGNNPAEADNIPEEGLSNSPTDTTSSLEAAESSQATTPSLDPVENPSEAVAEPVEVKGEPAAEADDTTLTPENESASDDKKDDPPAEDTAQHAEVGQDPTDAVNPEQDAQEPKSGMFQAMHVRSAS